MEEEKYISVEVSTTEVKDMLMKHLDIRHGHRVAEVIIGHLVQTDKGMSQLFKALVGQFPVAKYSIGDMLWVKDNALPTWKFDMKATRALPTSDNGQVLVQVIDINIYKGYPYDVEYYAVEDKKTETGKHKMVISEAHIVEKAEDFTDILDQLENLVDEDDLPF